MTVQEIRQTIEAELTEFERSFRQAMKTHVPLLDKIMHYIVKRKGKQMRPMFVFLSARLTGDINESTYRAASLVELLHTATLVHDDVIDDAMERRGFFSINALWKNKIAVLVGDFLLSRGLILSIENDEFRHLKIISTAVKEMSEGELLQMEKSRNLKYSEEDYYTIIRQKTASLIAACCEAGAASASQDEDAIDKMRRFGEHVGLAFQIKDDLFDYGVTATDIGKPVGIDIQEKKVTLPLIHAFSQSTPQEKRKYLSLLKRKKKSRRQVDQIVTFVREKKGLEYARNKMQLHAQSAIQILHDFPEGEARDALQSLVEYTIQRKK